eukprot:3760343-Alexandrium_andersonii.AAC.1
MSGKTQACQRVIIRMLRALPAGCAVSAPVRLCRGAALAPVRLRSGRAPARRLSGCCSRATTVGERPRATT